MPTLEEVLAAEVKVLPTEESIEEGNNRLRVLYSFLETVSPTKTSLQDKLHRLDNELGGAGGRRAEMKLKADRAPVAKEMASLGKKEQRVVTKAREHPPRRYLHSLKH